MPLKLGTRDVNTDARAIVQRAVEEGMTVAEIAELCDVSEGSVERWRATGRADSARIEPLLAKLGRGSTRPTPAALAKKLAQIYGSARSDDGARKVQRRFRLPYADFMRVAGRTRLRDKFLGDLEEELDALGILMQRDTVSGVDTFFFARAAAFRAWIQHRPSKAVLERFYVRDDEEEEEVED